MHSEPIAYVVGDSTVRIDDLITIGAGEEIAACIEDPSDSRRIYTYRITSGGITTVYRCKVALREIIRKSDQQVAEYLALRVRRLRLFAFRGPTV